MKYLIIFITLLFFAPMRAQEFSFQKHQSPFVPILVFTGSIALNAIGDGLNDSNHKLAGHIFNATSIDTLLMAPFIVKIDKNKWGWYLASFMFIRMGTFNPIYNAVRGLPINYLGTSSPTDKLFTKLGGLGIFEYGVCFTIGISIPFNEFYK